MDPDQTDLGPHCLQKVINHKQMTKQTTIVVTGALRVNLHRLLYLP